MATRILNLLTFLLLLAIFNSALANVQPRIVGGLESQSDDWPFMSSLIFKGLEISVNNNAFNAEFLLYSPMNAINGSLVNCGMSLGLCDNATGRICLIQRGENFFTEKVRNCQLSGGIGAIIYNNENGTFLGMLSLAQTGIPAVSTSMENGLALLNLVDQNTTINFTDKRSTNVFCGASYIGDKWAVTAAHCVQQVDLNAILINIGGHDIAVNTDNLLNITSVFIHPDYDSENLTNDIALIELSQVPTGVAPVRIADQVTIDQSIQSQAAVYALGRGQQLAQEMSLFPSNAPTQNTLYQVMLNLVPNDQCNRAFNDYFSNSGLVSSNVVKDNMLCAGTSTGDSGTCYGDSGGPLILQMNGESFLLGITSWGVGCAQADLYDVYTKVSSFKTFIETRTSNSTGFTNADPSPEQQADPAQEQEQAFNEIPTDIFEKSDSKDTFLGTVNLFFLLVICFFMFTRFSINRY